MLLILTETLARKNRMAKSLATASKLTFAKNTVFMIINSRAQYKLKNNIVRANKAYLEPQRLFS